jgi:predicted transcriptional regulator
MKLDDQALTPEGCRAGRAILRWSAARLSAEAGVSANFIAKIEHGGPTPEESRRRIVAAFRRAGVQVFSAPARGAQLMPSRRRP